MPEDSRKKASARYGTVRMSSSAGTYAAFHPGNSAIRATKWHSWAFWPVRRGDVKRRGVIDRRWLTTICPDQPAAAEAGPVTSNSPRSEAIDCAIAAAFSDRARAIRVCTAVLNQVVTGGASTLGKLTNPIV